MTSPDRDIAWPHRNSASAPGSTDVDPRRHAVSDSRHADSDRARWTATNDDEQAVSTGHRRAPEIKRAGHPVGDDAHCPTGTRPGDRPRSTATPGIRTRQAGPGEDAGLGVAKDCGVMPAFSRASWVTSSNSRCWGSILSASRRSRKLPRRSPRRRRSRPTGGRRQHRRVLRRRVRKRSPDPRGPSRYHLPSTRKSHNASGP